ncbi:PspC domain-containing protein [Cryobacterium sp. N22]|uniref:PspC domain-containing protein n=1 Tax=Cryobacterium sp. N22 TaxID=2048290 RepID=UPI001304C573|nr:PspC domain-containing protein [Cryobacterium sp. N22]
MTETPSYNPPPAPYGAPSATRPPQAPGGTAFFDWVRGLGFVRGQDRWLAGVCGAVAARTGLDPLIVRGIAVVIAILGGPIFFLYAVGWALMPDESGRSLVEQAARQVFEPAMIAVGVLLFFTFVPWMQGIWWQGPPEIWGMPGWLEVLLRTSWAIGLTAGIIVLVIYIAKRVPSPRNQPAGGKAAGGYQPSSAFQSGAAPQPATASQPDTTQSDATQQSAAQPESSSASQPTPTATFIPPVPPVPEPPTPAGPSLWDDLTGKTTAAAQYGTAPYGSAPYGSASTGSAAPYGTDPGQPAPATSFDPHSYRASQRRKQLGAGFISVVAGLALSAGAVAASFVADGAWSNSAFLVGASAALAVIALGIVVAGVRGKEGGWLNFFSIVLAGAMAWTAFIPVGTDVVPFGDPTWQYSTSSPTGFAMFAGAPVIDLTDVDTAPASADHTVDVWIAFGDVELVLPDNRTVAVEASSLAGGVDYTGIDDLDRGGVFFHDSRVVAEGTGTGVTTVRVWTLFGQVTIDQPALR